MTDTEFSFNQMTIYDLVNFIDKTSTKIKVENGITEFFALFLKLGTRNLADTMIAWINWYVDVFIPNLEEAKVIEVDEKMLNFIKSPEFQKVINETEPLMSIQDELKEITKNKSE